MQATELTMLNSSQTVYSLDNNEKYQPKSLVVISNSGTLDLAVIGKQVEVDPEMEFVKIIRLATDIDKQINCENCKYARSLLPEIKKEADKLDLNMKIGFISVNLDKNKIYVNYTADDRVDFRELIKLLGTKYKARIEMRQIGNRDETKHIGALGVCGRVTCCKAFLDDFDKVSIKMAKNQNISLNPTRINGMCGRLLCCLKYEDEFYADMQKKMPKVGANITTPDGKGVVSATDFLRETVSVTFTKDDTTEVKVYSLSDIQNSKEKNNK